MKRLIYAIAIWGGGIFYAMPAGAEPVSQKIVYLEVDGESEGDESLFAGLILEDKVEVPEVRFERKLEPVPHKNIDLSPSLRTYIIRHQGENLSATPVSK